jgi:hypothetical protein
MMLPSKDMDMAKLATVFSNTLNAPVSPADAKTLLAIIEMYLASGIVKKNISPTYSMSISLSPSPSQENDDDS